MSVGARMVSTKKWSDADMLMKAKGAPRVIPADIDFAAETDGGWQIRSWRFSARGPTELSGQGRR